MSGSQPDVLTASPYSPTAIIILTNIRIFVKKKRLHRRSFLNIYIYYFADIANAPATKAAIPKIIEKTISPIMRCFLRLLPSTSDL